ncbi:helix-turn-helix transcriptional regulator [Listeria monocytogenes]|nr:helix-turn-helix transcriptional regulator [Listeria monocytogenes]
MAIYMKLKEERKRKQWTQNVLAEKIDVSREVVGRWERLESIPTLKNCKSICRVFDITMDYLIKDEIDTKDNQLKYMKLGKDILDLANERYPIYFIRKYHIISKEEIFAIPRKKGLDFLSKVRTNLEKEDIGEDRRELRNYMREFIFSWYKFDKARFQLAKSQKLKNLEVNAILFSEDEIESKIVEDYPERPVMLLRDLIVNRLEKYLCEEYSIDVNSISKDYEFENEVSEQIYKLVK